jgi:7-keto-8-aminopelargonate synthetase-like enzyme
MATQTSFLDSVSNVIQTGVQHGILHRYTDDANISDIEFSIDGRSFVNFGSCSYLGLEFNPSMKASAIRAIEKYGTQFSSSRAYVSISLYKELEEKFRKIFGKPVVMAQTTSLAHIAALPVLVGEKDAVILDHQVHNSVQTAASLLKSKNIHVEMIRHNRMDLLEERILELRKTKKKVWYLCDGIYSMYGDSAPVDEIKKLLVKFPELWIYADDSHGMSSFGKNGRGFILDQFENEPRLVTAASTSKGFAAGGSILIFPNEELARSVRNCGGPLITSGPLQPAVLGAAMASADIHLSPEIEELQEQLRENILYANLIIKKYGLPLVFESPSPVFYIAAGAPRVSYNILKKMMLRGFYLNLGAFPAVPMKNSGIRFTITARHTFEQIHAMLDALADIYPQSLQEEGSTPEDVGKAFKMEMPVLQRTRKLIYEKAEELFAETFLTANDLPVSEWDERMERRGIFSTEGLKFLESSFKENEEEENRWDFDYLVVRDPQNRIVLCTFFTTAWMKDDMLSSKNVSGKVEMIREKTNNRFYGSSRVLMTGSLLSEGEHLFIDDSSPYAKEAIQIFHRHAASLMEKRNASMIMLRDFPAGDNQFEKEMNENGYFSFPMPESFAVHLDGINTKESFLDSLSFNAKKNLKKEVIRHEDLFYTSVVQKPDDLLVEEIYFLYLQVKNSSLELNTYTLPLNVFYEMAENKNWEFILVYKKGETAADRDQLVSAVMSWKGKDIYHPMLAGVRKNVSSRISPYRQALYRMTIHAIENNYTKINLGFSAGVEKRKLGAKGSAFIAFMQAKDHFAMESLMYQPETKTVIGI